MKAKIEFKPTRYSGSGWAYEINYYVEDLIEFLEFCEVGDRAIRSVKQIMKDKRRTKPYIIYKPTKCEIYPKENRVSKLEVGIHYICQHGFDILPSSIIAGIHNTHFEKDARHLGTLYPEEWLKESLYPDLEDSYPVTTTDISRGFLLDLQEVKKYHNNFSIWIIERRKKFPISKVKEKQK